MDAVEILWRLYGRVTIPDVVLKELANEMHRRKLLPGPQRDPNGSRVRPAPVSDDPSREGLDAGERAAILFAQRQTDREDV